jgi:hypothetical protein
MRRILGAAFTIAILMLGGLAATVPAQAKSRAATLANRITSSDQRPTDVSARRYYRNYHVYRRGYYRPYWRWHRPYYSRPYYRPYYYQPYYSPYGYTPYYNYGGWGPRYYGATPGYYGWGQRYYGCCGWGWGGPRFYGPAFGLNFGF